MTAQRVHGGPDAGGAARFDFSTNSNACGPCPSALQALHGADPSHYPDPHYTHLCKVLAAFHGVDAARIVLAASGSEFIFRITAWMARQGCTAVSLPTLAYGDYAHAAQQWGLKGVNLAAQAERAEQAEHSGSAPAGCLVWSCEPSSPLGGADPYLLQVSSQDLPQHISQNNGQNTVVWDCAYVPLRLSGMPSLSAAQQDRVWRLYSPNKALGLTGVRAAYAIAPLHAQDAVAQLNALAPSWPLGAHGVALLQAWTQTDTQQWLAHSLETLRGWKTRQLALLQSLGWECRPSDAPFFSARPSHAIDVAALRAQGIKLRDTASMGLPGWWRISVQPPVAQDALASALQSQLQTAQHALQKEFA